MGWFLWGNTECNRIHLHTQYRARIKMKPRYRFTVPISYLWRKLLFVVSTMTIRTGLFRLEVEIICVRLILALSLCSSISIFLSLFTRQREMKGKRMSKEYSFTVNKIQWKLGHHKHSKLILYHNVISKIKKNKKHNYTRTHIHTQILFFIYNRNLIIDKFI